ncbi:hypothetical protein PHYSODRAFT_251823 [Phytophthora sojae]|uniref:Uncharacterized protein n=1 Tax=Phytophthora sojae (strain P6497) TaxID=1094619 RepID=G5ACE7_PHYSP|nr:hypothetical protein PHYSODRAFT_251823 [Phytophthora sojae]EGZ07021.1 hypothetical protein PHYSODRAFT_251823 [Phytophthora sojae]|eukprot:XP_009537785.1 hypothetical protein PHYSODRAFT_251823 [Phytophthora sojae]
MHWTDELNALLNQCVFASGYDFGASSELFCRQAAKLRRFRVALAFAVSDVEVAHSLACAASGDEELKLTANQCQEQWMALNPTEDDDDDHDHEDKAERPETEADDHLGPRASELNDTAPPEVDEDDDEEDSAVIPDGGPRLELSLSDAELDMLLSTLPPSEGPEASSSADAKDRQSSGVRSEMQWVLAFLTDPDAIASVDVEAKNLMGSPEKHDDDNYQVFLQDLQEANLMAPAPTAIERHSHRQEVTEPATGEDNCARPA